MSIKVSTFKGYMLYPQTTEKFDCYIKFLEKGLKNPYGTDTMVAISSSQFPFPTRATESYTYAGLNFTLPGRLQQSGTITVQLPETWLADRLPNVLQSFVSTVYDSTPAMKDSPYSQQTLLGPVILDHEVEISLSNPLTVTTISEFLLNFVAGMTKSAALQTATTTIEKITNSKYGKNALKAVGLGSLALDHTQMVTAHLGYCYVLKVNPVEVSYEGSNASKPVMYNMTIQYNTLHYSVNQTILTLAKKFASKKVQELIDLAAKGYASIVTNPPI